MRRPLAVRRVTGTDSHAFFVSFSMGASFLILTAQLASLCAKTTTIMIYCLVKFKVGSSYDQRSLNLEGCSEGAAKMALCQQSSAYKDAIILSVTPR